MRIIEQSKEIEKTCPRCKTRFAFVKDDIRTDMAVKNKCVYCPNCHYRIDITDEAEIANCIEFKERMKEFDKPAYTCEWCGADFKGESYIGKYGAEWAACPKCGEETFVGEGIDVTVDTIEYPKHFVSFGNGKSVNDDEINEWIKEAVSKLNKDVDYSGHESGDTIVFVCKSDEDSSSATVIVAKKYQECEVKISRKNF